MIEYIISKRGYFYKVVKNEKKRITKEEYTKKINKKLIQKGGIKDYDSTIYLEPGDISRLSPKIAELFGEKFIKYGVRDDGSYAFLASRNPDYRNLSNPDKKKFGLEFRKKIASEIPTYFDSTHLGEFGYTAAELQKLYNNKKEWVGQETWSYLSDIYNVNIIIFRGEDDKIYCGQEQFNPDRNYILLFNIGDIHYESILEVLPYKNGNTNGIFRDSDDIIQRIKKYYDVTCK